MEMDAEERLKDLEREAERQRRTCCGAGCRSCTAEAPAAASRGEPQKEGGADIFEYMQRGAPSKEGIEEIKQASKGDILALFPTRPDKKTLKAFEKIAQRYYKFLSAASSADEEERCEEDIAKILKTVEERGQKKGKKKILLQCRR